MALNFLTLIEKLATELQKQQKKNNKVPCPVVVEYANLGEGGNVKCKIEDVVFEDGKLVLVTEDAI